MKLPPALAPWRAQLERFPEELAFALAPLVERLAAAVGPLASAYVGSAEPNGFDGVSQRGDYQRLLASEWLLAAEAPDEFLRRAAMQEHLFLRISRREPAGCKRSLALFDAGPTQLGTPRLAHLAMLAVLERRAQAAGAEFGFGVLQRPEPVRPAADATGVRHLLSSRSPLETSAAQIAVWLDLLQPLAEDEIWWVGGARLRQLVASHPGPRMIVRDPLRAENDRLEVDLQLRERQHHVVLELPEPALRTRLIRDPFQVAALVALPKSSGDFRFSQDGRRLLVHRHPLVYAYHAAHAPEVFRPPPGTKLVALTWHRRHFGALVRGQGGWFLLAHGQQYPVGFVGRKPAPPLGSEASCQLALLGKRAERALLLDAQGSLFRGERHSDGGYRFRPMVDGVLLLDSRPGHFVYFARTSSGVAVGNVSGELNIVALDTVPATATPLVFSTHDPMSQLGAFAVEVPASERAAAHGRCRWAIHGPAREPELVEIHADHRVLGLVVGPGGRRPAGNHDFRLLVRPASARGLLGVGVQGADPLLGTEDATGTVALSPRGRRLAYRTIEGHVCVRDVWVSALRRVIRMASRGEHRD